MRGTSDEHPGIHGGNGMRLRSTAVVLLVMALGTAIAAGQDAQLRAQQALTQLRTDLPDLKVYSEGSRVSSLYGEPITFGDNPRDSAEQFRTMYADVLGVEADDLVPDGTLRKGNPEIPLMYNPETGKYKMSALRYSQQKDGIPVFRSRLSLVVRNEKNYPLVMVSSSLRDLSNYSPVSSAAKSLTELAAEALRPELAEKAVVEAGAIEGFRGEPISSTNPAFTHYSEPELVIWAGTGKIKVDEPVMAVVYTADNHGDKAADKPLRWLFVADVHTGEILYSENRICFTDVSGNVSGNVTQGAKAMHCSPEVLTPFEAAFVSISGGNSTYTDANGDFTITNSGSSSVTVLSPMGGHYFDVNNYAGSTEDLSMSVTPPGPANFVHNSANTQEFVIAQANGYRNSNQVRSWVLQQNPNYPTIYTQTDFPVYVNRNDGYCPGNAWYDPWEQSINFCRRGTDSGQEYANTSFASVSQHEYGHHVVEMGGSEQEAYGEGMADSIAMLLTDDPGLGYGFFYDQCNSPLRNADNDYQYPCTGEIHECGQLLSGSIWSTRCELAATYPTTYLDIISNLTVNSVLLHDGGDITPQIYIDFLTLDDDDADLSNGTPHYSEIHAGFDAHNMIPPEPPANDYCTDAVAVCPGALVSGSTLGATNDGTSSCGSSTTAPDVWYSYTPESSGTATIDLCSGATYDTVISLHTGCPGSSTQLECDDDGCGSPGGPSTVTHSVTAYQTYYIRVTGWSGASGNFDLNIAGPSCTVTYVPLRITFPDGLPTTVVPGVDTPITVRIENVQETYVRGSGTLHYRYGNGAFATVPVVKQSVDIFTATLPAGGCTETPEFYITARGDAGSDVYEPEDAPATVHAINNPCAGDTWCYEAGDECLGYGNGDFDIDGDVDLHDFAQFQICFGQLGINDCLPGNMTGDGVIDLNDFALFAAEMP